MNSAVALSLINMEYSHLRSSLGFRPLWRNDERREPRSTVYPIESLAALGSRVNARAARGESFSKPGSEVGHDFDRSQGPYSRGMPLCNVSFLLRPTHFEYVCVRVRARYVRRRDHPAVWYADRRQRLPSSRYSQGGPEKVEISSRSVFFDEVQPTFPWRKFQPSLNYRAAPRYRPRASCVQM